jgi:hypothetical protein
VIGIAFRDVTAVGDAAWVKRLTESRELGLRNSTDELNLLAKVARLSDAKVLLQGDPDSSLNAPLKAFWRDIQRNVGNDPVSWGAFVGRRMNEAQTFIRILKEQSELRREGN